MNVGVSVRYRMEIPRDQGIDCTLALLTEGYNFIPNRLKRYQTNIFQSRLMGQKVICMSGKEAAEIFYDTEKFQRAGAAPPRIQKSLFGQKGVQTLDGQAHKHRKQLFMSLMTAERLNVLSEMTTNQWQETVGLWEQMNHVELYNEVNKMMCQIACKWADVPLKYQELEERTKELAALIDAFGAVGPRHWRGRQARKQADRWAAHLIQQVRDRKLHPHKESALYKMAWHLERNGQLMDIRVAAVELINILRPIVAIGRYITFGALAMHEFPDTRKKMQMENDDYKKMFVQEVRRYYPFGPFLGARVRRDFFWNGHDFKKGTLVILDAYGMNRSSELWDNPDTFYPERFANRQDHRYDFIPQGGGEYMSGHRCAGEWVTVEIMKKSLDFLANRMEYDVPKQDLSYSLTRMPTIIKSRFVIENVKQV